MNADVGHMRTRGKWEIVRSRTGVVGEAACGGGSARELGGKVDPDDMRGVSYCAVCTVESSMECYTKGMVGSAHSASGGRVRGAQLASSYEVWRSCVRSEYGP